MISILISIYAVSFLSLLLANRIAGDAKDKIPAWVVICPLINTVTVLVLILALILIGIIFLLNRPFFKIPLMKIESLFNKCVRFLEGRK